jgi:hypothetical protein
MNWKIIFQLSIFGLIMAFGTVSLIPQKVEPVFWLIIFIFSSFIIAKVCTGKYFLHGFLVAILNSVWITAVHAIYLTNYTFNHPDVVDLTQRALPSFAVHPRQAMIIMAPIFGVMFGIILGVFSFVMAKIVNKKSQ